jgi:hypothetical protein
MSFGEPQGISGPEALPLCGNGFNVIFGKFKYVIDPIDNDALGDFRTDGGGSLEDENAGASSHLKPPGSPDKWRLQLYQRNNFAKDSDWTGESFG